MILALAIIIIASLVVAAWAASKLLQRHRLRSDIKENTTSQTNRRSRAADQRQ